MKIAFHIAQRRIAITWFSFSALLFLLILAQSITGKFENKGQEAWGWFLALVIPNLALMISIFAKDIYRKAEEIFEVDRFYMRLTMILSIFYLLLILVVLLVQPLTGKPIIQLMHESSVFLGPLQGLVSASIGIFFTNKEKQ